MALWHVRGNEQLELPDKVCLRTVQAATALTGNKAYPKIPTTS
jgi:hypothetical protein